MHFRLDSGERAVIETLPSDCIKAISIDRSPIDDAERKGILEPTSSLSPTREQKRSDVVYVLTKAVS